MNYRVMQMFDGWQWCVVDLSAEGIIARFVNKMNAELFAETMNEKYPHSTEKAGEA